MATAKIYPHIPSPIVDNNLPSCLEEKETYTIWMKSLVLNSNGCTIFDSNGNLVYRIDNYDTKHSRLVYLMDLKGNVLCTFTRKKLSIKEHWNGFKCERMKGEKAWFQVKKIKKFFSKEKGLLCRVTMGSMFFNISGSSQKKSEFHIIRSDGVIVAQASRKQTSEGVTLGQDVLRLEIGAQMDRGLIIALVVVQALVSHQI